MSAVPREISLDALLDGPIDDVPTYANALRVALARIRPLPTPLWDALYERGLRAALASRDIAALSAIVSVYVNRLDGEGRVEDVRSTIRFALGLAGDDPDARLLLLAMRAPFECTLAAHELARATLREAASAARFATSPVARAEFAMCSSVVACRTFDARPREVEEQIGMAHRTGAFREVGLLLSWFIPFSVATSVPPQSDPWETMLGIEAESHGHRWRQADAEAFRWARATRRWDSEAVSPNAETIKASANWLASWRLLILDLFRARLLGNETRASEIVGELANVSRAGPAYRDGLPAFEALLRAASPGATVELEPPAHAGLENIGAILAGVEAVALAGSLGCAATWKEWLDRHLPAAVHTALEWPVARERVEALLDLKLGLRKEARNRFLAAIEWADGHGNRMESAIARVQLSYVSGVASPEARRELRDRGWAVLAAAAVDPTPFAFAALVVDAERSANSRSSDSLTPREAQVLSLLAQGLTYRRAADELGLSWRTVQNYAHRGYQKLGAHTRTEAVRRAKELSIL